MQNNEHKTGVRLLIGLAIGFLLIGANLGGDWPRFRGNSRQTGYNLESGFIAKPEILWSFDAGPLEAAPVIAWSTVFASNAAGNLTALSLDSGSLKWRFRGPAPMAAAPAVHRDLVLIGDLAGEVHALDLATGARKWKYSGRDPIVESINFSGPIVFVVTVGGNLNALDLESGRILWQFRGESLLTGSAALNMDHLAFSQADGRLIILEVATGRQQWSVYTGSHLDQPPVLLENRVYQVLPGGETLMLDIVTGEIQFGATGPTDGFAPIVSESILVLAGGDGEISGFTCNGDRALWSQNVRGRLLLAPIAWGSQVAFVEAGGYLVVLDLFTGARLWDFDTGAAIKAGPAIGLGRLVLAQADGRLLCLGSRPRDSVGVSN